MYSTIDEVVVHVPIRTCAINKASLSNFTVISCFTSFQVCCFLQAIGILNKLLASRLRGRGLLLLLLLLLLILHHDVSPTVKDLSKELKLLQISYQKFPYIGIDLVQ